MPDHLASALAVVPLSLYLLNLARWHSGRHPRVVSGAVDAALLSAGLGGVVLFGPFGQGLAARLFGKPGVLAWLTLVSGMALVAILLSKRSWRRLVVYHVDPEVLRSTVREVLDLGTGRFVPTVRGFEDANQSRGVTIEVSPRMRAATIEAYGHDAEGHIRGLESRLRRRLASEAAPPSRLAWFFLATSALVLLVPTAGWVLREPGARDALRALFERLSRASIRH